MKDTRHVYIAITNDYRILKKGDVLRNFRDEEWTYQSTTHPRKVFVTAKDDPNGPDSWPNMASREFYPSVFDLGIWDISTQEWTWAPDWDETELADFTTILRGQHIEDKS